MNKFNFNHPGGYPHETDVYEELVKAFSIFNALAHITGEKAILQGASLIGQNQVEDGYVCIEGEVLEFRGGNPLPNVKIYEQSTEKEFLNGDLNEVFFERWVGFGSGVGSFPFSDLKRIKPLWRTQKAVVPIGGIIQWPSSSPIPDGWENADGYATISQGLINIRYTG